MAILSSNGKLMTIGGTIIKAKLVDPYNPLNLPPFTIRLKYRDNVTPTFSKGTGVQVSSSPNIWDLTYESQDWSYLLDGQVDLIEVIDANTSGVTDMQGMFNNCSILSAVALFDTSDVTNMDSMFYSCRNLTSIPLFDTSKVTDMGEMLHYCRSLTTVPLFNTSKVTNMDRMCMSCESLTSIPLLNTSSCTNMSQAFYACYNVQSGALALYQQASTQATPPSIYSGAFENCGSNTTTGAAELAQIPSDWK